MNSLVFSADTLATEARRASRLRQLGLAARCTWCGETDPMALSLRKRNGQVICLRCAARFDRRPVAHARWRVCLACGFVARPDEARTMELHHVLGRANHPSVVVPLCLNCHAKVSEVQRSGVDLADFDERTARLIEGTGWSVALAFVVWDASRGRARWQRWASVGLAAVAGLRGVLEVARGRA